MQQLAPPACLTRAEEVRRLVRHLGSSRPLIRSVTGPQAIVVWYESADLLRFSHGCPVVCVCACVCARVCCACAMLCCMCVCVSCTCACVCALVPCVCMCLVIVCATCRALKQLTACRRAPPRSGRSARPGHRDPPGRRPPHRCSGRCAHRRNRPP